MGFIVYATATYAILKNKNIFIVLTGFTLLLLNPYLLDFFSIARGYGIALGLFMAAFYFFIKAHGDTKKNFVKNAFLSLFFSLLATTANFTYINFYFASLVIFIFEFFILIKKDEVEWSKKRSIYAWIVVVLNIACIYGIVSILLILKKAGQLYFGGYHNNFIDDTLLSLIHGFIYKSYYGEIAGIALRQLIMSVFILTLLYQYIKEYDALYRITIVLFIMIGGSIVEYYIFDTPYPSGRTALIFVPLFGVYLLFSVEKLLSYVKKHILFHAISILIFLVISVPFSYHFIKNINFNYVYEWPYDSNTKQAIQKIKEAYEKYSNKDRGIVISNSWVFEPSINHYKRIYSMDYMTEATRDPVHASADFIYLLQSDMKPEIKKLYSVLYMFPSTKSILLKSKINNFEINEISNKQVQLKTTDNKYLCVDDSKYHFLFTNNKPSFGSTFSLIRYANNKCAIATSYKQYLCSELGLYGRITGTRTKIGAWETFTLIELDSNFVAFKAVNGKFFSVDKKTSQLYAKAGFIGITEKFKIIKK
ncbi:MAG: fascin domain-containing protein [Bacteroidota bacterium]